MGFAIYYAHQFEKFNAFADKLAQFENLLGPKEVIKMFAEERIGFMFIILIIFISF